MELGDDIFIMQNIFPLNNSVDTVKVGDAAQDLLNMDMYLHNNRNEATNRRQKGTLIPSLTY